jgi:acyl-CoA thioesterase-1
MRRLLDSVFALALLAAVVLAAGCGGEEAVVPEPPSSRKISWEGTIVAFGDSLTAGYRLEEREAYPALLQGMLVSADKPWRVINAGVSGETSSGALSRVEWVLKSLGPDIVILETGANDGLRGIDVDLARKNIFAIVTGLQEGGVTVILAGMQMVKNLGEDYGQSFAALYGEVAAETGAILIPFFLEGVAGDPSLNLDDGIHPNADGCRIIAGNVYPYVREAIERPRKD